MTREMYRSIKDGNDTIVDAIDVWEEILTKKSHALVYLIDYYVIISWGIAPRTYYKTSVLVQFFIP